MQMDSEFARTKLPHTKKYSIFRESQFFYSKIENQILRFRYQNRKWQEHLHISRPRLQSEQVKSQLVQK